MRSPRTLRARFTAVGFAIAAVTIGVLTIAFNLTLHFSADSDANGRLRSLARATASTVAVRDGHVVATRPADGLPVWIYDGARAVRRPAARAGLQREADALIGRSHVLRDLDGSHYRLYALPIDAGGRQVGTVVAGLSLDAYDRTTDQAAVGSAVLAALLLAVVSWLTWIVVGRVLKPVQAMTRSASNWSADGAPQRFGSTDHPAELAELAETFDALLDRVAASLRHEQRLSAELSHELRTPLARITAEVELLQRRERPADERAEAYMSISHSAHQMHEILETLMATARADAGLDRGRCDVGAVVAELERAWPADGVALTAGATGGVTVGVEREVVERILAPLLDNARRFARSRVDVRAGVGGTGRVVVTVADDGPGVPEPDRELVFEPGRTGPTTNGHGGAGLGLALSRRLARAAGGDVRADAAVGLGGAAFRVELPG